MFKNFSWSIKEKLIAAAILFWLIMSKFMMDAQLSGLSGFGFTLLEVLSAAAFSFLLISSLTEKAFSLKSSQTFFAAMSVAMVAGLCVSLMLVSRESFIVILIMSIMLLCAKKWYLLPVVSVLSIIMSFHLITQSVYNYITLACTPAAICVSLASVSNEIQNSDTSKTKKIIGAVVVTLFNLVNLGCVLNTFYSYRFAIAVQNVSLISLFAAVSTVIGVAASLVLAVFAIINKKFIESIGYAVLAICGIIPVMMELRINAWSVTALYLALTVVSAGDSTAENTCMYFAKALSPKKKHTKLKKQTAKK